MKNTFTDFWNFFKNEYHFYSEWYNQAVTPKMALVFSEYNVTYVTQTQQNLPQLQFLQTNCDSLSCIHVQ